MRSGRDPGAPHPRALHLEALFLAAIAACALALVPATGATQEIPDDPDVLAARADTLYRTGRFADARPLYRELVRLEPGNGMAWYRLGTARYQTGEFRGAAEGWTRALESGFNTPVAAYNAASAWGRLEEPDSALTYLRIAVEEGFANEGLVRRDPDLTPVRERPEFEELVGGVSRNAHPCRFDPRHRALEFALGRWRMEDGQGNRVGTDIVEAVSDGCGFRLLRTSGQGDTVTTLFHLDPASGEWGSVSVGSAGALTRLRGGFAGDTLRLEGERTGPDGETGAVRILLAPRPDRRLEHRVESRSEDGTWSPSLEVVLEREGWAPGAGSAADGSPSLRYVAFHGGRRAGAWQESTIEAWAQENPELVTAHRLYDIYAAPVPRALHDVIRQSPPPDVLGTTIAGVTVDYVRQGRVTDITDLWAEEGWDEAFPEALVEMSTVEGRRWFVPAAVQANPVYYRPDLFRELGIEPPTTWDELLGACRTLADAGKTPFTNSFAWPPPLARWFTMLNLRLNGPDFHRSLMRGRVSWQDDRVRRVFDRWIGLFREGCLSPESAGNTYGQAVAELVRGEAGMWLIGEWVHEGQPPEVADQLDFFPFPVLDPELPRAEIVHVYGALIPADAPNPDQARRFLARLGSRESQAARLEGQDRLPARLDVSLEEAHPRHRKGRAFLREVDVAVPLFEVSTHRDVARTAMRSFQAFWRDPGAGTVERILADLEEAREAAYGPAGG